MRSRIHFTRAWCTASRWLSSSCSTAERCLGGSAPFALKSERIRTVIGRVRTLRRSSLLGRRHLVQVNLVAVRFVGAVYLQRLPSGDFIGIGDDASAGL